MDLSVAIKVKCSAIHQDWWYSARSLPGQGPLKGDQPENEVHESSGILTVYNHECSLFL